MRRSGELRGYSSSDAQRVRLNSEGRVDASGIRKEPAVRDIEIVDVVHPTPAVDYKLCWIDPCSAAAMQMPATELIVGILVIDFFHAGFGQQFRRASGQIA